MILEAEIKKFTEEFLNNSEYFLVDVVIGAAQKRAKISVYLDGDKGISIEQCAKVSRYLSSRIDDELGMEEGYVIEVSSAGIDSPLKLKRQYVKNIGRQVEVVKFDGMKESGTLKTVDDEKVTLETKKKGEFTINNKDIKQTKVVITF